ncbi:MAG: amidohydrolase family protein [Pseudomonadota bacterium]
MTIITAGANKLMQVPNGRLDGHAHVFDINQQLISSRRYTPANNAPWADFRDVLLSNNIGGAILVQPSFLGTNNSYLLDFLKDSRSEEKLKFCGVVVVNPDIDFAELKELNDLGVIGIRLNLISGGCSSTFKIRDWLALFKMLDRLGMHLEVYNSGWALAQILPVILNHVHTVVVDHFGMPDVETLCGDSGQIAIRNAPLGRVFVKASGPYRIFKGMPSQKAAELCIPLFKCLYESIGPDQIVWGSDWPWTQFEDIHDYRETMDWCGMWGNSITPELA